MEQDGLAAFDRAVEQVDQARRALQSDLEQTTRISAAVRQETSMCARDLLAFCSLFRDTYSAALDDLRRDVQVLEHAGLSWLVLSAEDRQRAEVAAQFWTNRLVIAYKAFYFFCHAYHDVLVCTLLGRRGPGAFSMMQALEETDNAIATMVRQAYPEYGAWLLTWREQWHTISQGTPCRLVGPVEDRGLSFTPLSAAQGAVDMTGDLVVRLGGVTQALHVSARLVLEVLEHVRV